MSIELYGEIVCINTDYSYNQIDDICIIALFLIIQVYLYVYNKNKKVRLYKCSQLMVVYALQNIMHTQAPL
ncbi:hypothetical protein AQUCO_00100823v1 [Aquilegia coerulea]|uniref:Uncharacterized protein n=1 Tax=Aquilegia coerulea TaxID=218851 RepID=A0A2G5FC44_AQUCA|nr:hypothetical protein AQUCO_00100823v1 [Aquilegia coerulea]